MIRAGAVAGLVKDGVVSIDGSRRRERRTSRHTSNFASDRDAVWHYGRLDLLSPPRRVRYESQSSRMLAPAICSSEKCSSCRSTSPPAYPRLEPQGCDRPQHPQPLCRQPRPRAAREVFVRSATFCRARAGNSPRGRTQSADRPVHPQPERLRGHPASTGHERRRRSGAPRCACTGAAVPTHRDGRSAPVAPVRHPCPRAGLAWQVSAAGLSGLRPRRF